MSATMVPNYRRPPSFLSLFLGKVILLLVTIIVVWCLYAYLHAYRLDWLGWFYVKLLPLTHGLYGLVDTYFPNEVKYKVRAAITTTVATRATVVDLCDSRKIRPVIRSPPTGLPVAADPTAARVAGRRRTDLRTRERRQAIRGRLGGSWD